MSANPKRPLFAPETDTNLALRAVESAAELQVSHAASEPATAADRNPKRAHLRLLPQLVSRGQSQRAKKPNAIAMATVCGVTALAIISVQVGLTAATSQGAFDVTSLRQQTQDTARVERVLAQNVDSLSSPQNLADNAQALGMVQNNKPAYLRLSDAAIFGDPQAATTEQALTNTVANATLSQMPVFDETGQEFLRGTQAASLEQSADSDANAPVLWSGELPAPNTH